MSTITELEIVTGWVIDEQAPDDMNAIDDMGALDDMDEDLDFDFDALAPAKVTLNVTYTDGKKQLKTDVKDLPVTNLVRIIRNKLGAAGKLFPGKSIVPERQRIEVSGVPGSLDSVLAIQKYPQLRNGATISLSISDEIIFIGKTALDASKAGIHFVESKGVDFSKTDTWGYYVGTTGPREGLVVGLSAAGNGTPFKVRVDFDTDKGFHFNAEVGKGSTLAKQACIVRNGSWDVKKIKGEWHQDYVKFANRLQSRKGGPIMPKENILKLFKEGK